ncbi:hypothetical protein [Rothia dentocariosa]
MFTALPAATLLFPGVKRALISRKRRKILFLEIKAPLAEKDAGAQNIMHKTEKVIHKGYPAAKKINARTTKNHPVGAQRIPKPCM